MNDKIAVSGGFDPIHIGHLRMLKEASEYGDLYVIVNSDDWLIRKKGYVFMPFEDRAEIISSFSCVYSAVTVNDTDGTVCSALKKIKPKYFANGGDRVLTNTPEYDICNTLGIEMIWNIGGGKMQSSSELVQRANSCSTQ